MALRLYNTLTRKKEDFVPLDATNVRLYACGPTVYDEAHIGNARPVIVFDVLFRLLRHLYGADHVTYVRNVTDIDDKINRRAFERGVSIRQLTDGTLAQFEKDVAALGNLPPTHQPRATDFVCAGEQRTDMVRIIERLVEKGHAYEAAGHVLFHVPSMPDYGRLSRRPLDEMIAGARVDVAPFKRDPMDFVLWKPSTEAHEPGWDSPWGKGRPGWHIECSAMSGALLGETFDIHAGGIDLIFPHHENEIAQTRCAFGVDRMASVWMHNGFLQVEGRKMSKSEGNFVTIRELLETNTFGGNNWIGPVLRLAMLKTHYRQPIDWTVRALEEAQDEFRSFAAVVPDYSAQPVVDERFLDALSDDLNTSEAFARLHELLQKVRKGDVESGRALLGSLKLLGLFDYSFGVRHQVSGYDPDQPDTYLDAALRQVASDYPISVIADRIRSRWPDADLGQYLSKFSAATLVFDLRRATGSGGGWVRAVAGLDQKRNAARAAKNWAESDRIRDELLAQGIVLKDNKDGTTTWEVKR